MEPIPLSRPEGGAERDIVFAREHKCPQGNALRRVLPEPDLLVFPVGLVGWEMPFDVPFVVEAPEPCSACGGYIAAWFRWTGPKVLYTKQLWEPGDD